MHAQLVEVAQTLGSSRSLACEVVYVDDGSSDDTLAIARQLPASALDVQVVSLSRNFGKEAALLAGLDHTRLGAVLFIDGDGQHPTALIETLVGHWLDDGYDVVYTAKAHRANESVMRRILVKGFYLLINWGARSKIPEDAGDFRLLSPRAANALRHLPERNRFFKGLSSWIGFRQIRIAYKPEQRADGRTSWNLRSLIGLSIDGLTAFSVAPLRVATMLGLVTVSYTHLDVYKRQGRILGRRAPRNRADASRPHRSAKARARVSRSTHPLCRIERHPAQRRARAIRRRGAVRRPDFLRHADATLPAQARTCAGELPARARRRGGLRRRARLRLFARQSALCETHRRARSELSLIHI